MYYFVLDRHDEQPVLPHYLNKSLFPDSNCPVIRPS